jgi:hypothetical protein
MLITLTRYQSADTGTFGKLFDANNSFLCYTCERPWYDNLPGKSCIPTGSYSVVPHNSADHPDTWELLNVTNRVAILIHNGNTIRDTEGCILVGNPTGVIDGLPAVLHSVDTLNMLRKTLPQTFTLIIS